MVWCDNCKCDVYGDLYDHPDAYGVDLCPNCKTLQAAPQIIECAAWDLISGKYSDLVDVSHSIQVGNGKQRYYLAALSGTGKTVRLERFRDGTLFIIKRYVPIDADVRLVPITT